MGNLKTFFVAMVLLLSGSAIMAGPSEDHSVFPARNRDLFVVKTGKDLVGAKVEIFSDNGELVTTQIAQKRKVYIDFRDASTGTYLVKLSKGDKTKELSFRKK
jgi:hypothetical protein